MENEKVKDIVEWGYCIIIAVIIAIVIKNFLGTPTVVQQDSMYSTLVQGDRLVLSRISKTFKKMPEHGDIITFEAPSKLYYEEGEVDLENPVARYDNEPTSIWKKFTYYVLEIGKTSYIKRAIGLPGDHILIEDGKVYVNGEMLDEQYLDEGKETIATGLFNDFTVPENTVFAMGDNRTVSMDCRAFGCIPLDKIEGKVAIRFWPLNKIGKVE